MFGLSRSRIFPGSFTPRPSPFRRNAGYNDYDYDRSNRFFSIFFYTFILHSYAARRNIGTNALGGRRSRAGRHDTGPAALWAPPDKVTAGDSLGRSSDIARGPACVRHNWIISLLLLYIIIVCIVRFWTRRANADRDRKQRLLPATGIHSLFVRYSAIALCRERYA